MAIPAKSSETEAKGLLPSGNPITLGMDAVINERNVSSRSRVNTREYVVVEPIPRRRTSLYRVCRENTRESS